MADAPGDHPFRAGPEASASPERPHRDSLSLLGRLRRAREGAIALYIAIAAVPLVGFLGLAVDTTRAHVVKAQLSQALDAAALAGGRVMFSETRDADIAMYFSANFPSGFLGSTVDGPHWVIDGDQEVIAITASATLPTTFLRVLGQDSMTVSAHGEVTRQTTMLDVVISIDMSGSMTATMASGGTQIDAAREAALDLVDILFGEDETKALLNIGLVPWNGKVNVMLNTLAFDSTATVTETVPTFINPVTQLAQDTIYFANNSPVPLLSPPPASWKGCVFSRYLHDGMDDTNADDRKYAYAFGQVEWKAWEPIGPEGEPIPVWWQRCSMAITLADCTPCLGHGITPLTNERSVITAAVNELQSPTGATNIPQGLGWAWRVLMPGAPFDQADPTPQFNRKQAIILLSDGENFGASGDGYKGVFGFGATARPAMDNRLRKVAERIKEDGVVIYTIQFAHDGTELAALMKEVASGPDAPFYHYAPDGEALRQVFREVANNLSELRLSR